MQHQHLQQELDWFEALLSARIQLYFGQECPYSSIEQISPPIFQGSESPYARVVSQLKLGFEERAVLMLALAPHVCPALLDPFFTPNGSYNRPYTQFGGWKGMAHSGFLPTGETAAYLIAGSDLGRRLSVGRLFEPEHIFAKENILKLDNISSDEPLLSGKLCLSAEYLQRCTTGISHKPDFSGNFPAKLISTQLNWEDLVLAPEVMNDVMHVSTWIRHAGQIMSDFKLEKVVKPGYRCLFYGPPGTGKTLTASLFGKSYGLDVYRIDLSMIVSKYIGETEKNLGAVFDQAKNKNWILFFDEADSLFGKRTQANSSNDRHANQETSYLLQKIEDFPGVVILATNLRANLDEAFSRRFQSIIYFSMPDADHRYILWKNNFPAALPLSPSVSLRQIAQDYPLAGGAIINIVRYCAIEMLKQGCTAVSREMIVAGIAKELEKEGKVLK